MRSVQDDVTAIGRIAMVPTILNAMVRTTGMRFAAVARVTETTWTACAVRDDIAFGLQPGSELVLDTTICNEIRQHGQPVIFASASAHPHFRDHPTPKMYGLESYISIPIVRADGSFFGTLCAIDPKPATTLDDPGVRQTVELFAQLVAAQLDTQDLNAALQASEQRLREEVRRKDEFIAVLGHELRNPLAPIRTGVELLAHAAESPHIVEQVRPVMARQLSHMTRLVDDLLDVSRISSGKVRLQPQAASLQSLVDVAVEAQRGAIASAGLTLDVRLDDPELMLSVDPTRLSQVISNVLHNAAKFTPAGGHITLRTTRERRPGGQADELALRVADTGVGISAEQLPAIFELFTQVRPEDNTHGGMGIGLALARHLMALHGGTLTATSFGPGHGSEFTLRMPLPSTEAQAAAIDHVAGEAAGTAPPTPGNAANAADAAFLGLRVLVVDDNQDAADALAMLMETFGGEVHVVYDARRIADTVREFNPSLVLLDIGLPGVDGYEACRLIRQEKGSAVRIAALTGWGQESDRRLAEQAGFDVHLTKPVELERLAALAAQAR